jgi:hypothetical protein
VPRHVAQPRRRRARSERGFGTQSKASAAAVVTRRMRSSSRCRMRNSSGSIPALAAITSICDSRAKVFVLTDGARHGPTPNGCSPGGCLPCHPPADTVR